MNGVHDLGGKHGFGPVEREQNEPYFHADWEKAVMVMNLVGMVKRIYNIDEFRHAIERMGQAEYLDTSYYEHWLASVSTLLVEKGVIGREELDARTKEFERNPQTPLRDRKDPELLARLMSAVRKGMAEKSEPNPAPRFKAGDAVATRNWQPPGHTRLPGYARGHRGRIHAFHGVYILPDAHAH
ncbi:MAG TPA: nitrile hydratase subunit beta, partial [Methylomirabilota bacterium]